MIQSGVGTFHPPSEVSGRVVVSPGSGSSSMTDQILSYVATTTIIRSHPSCELLGRVACDDTLLRMSQRWGYVQ